MTGFGDDQSVFSAIDARMPLRPRDVMRSSFVAQLAPATRQVGQPWNSWASFLLDPPRPQARRISSFYGAAARLEPRIDPARTYLIGVPWQSFKSALPSTAIPDIRVVVGELFAQGDIVAVRRILQALAPEESDTTLRVLHSVIATPMVKRKPQSYGSRAADFEWLRTRSGPYSGRWVALHDGALICDAATLREALSRAAALRPGITPLVHRVL